MTDDLIARQHDVAAIVVTVKVFANVALVLQEHEENTLLPKGVTRLERATGIGPVPATGV